jgi:hypothetical protein
MSEFSIASCGADPIWITASGAYFVNADQSRVNIGCRVNISPGLSFSYFFGAVSHSRIQTEGAAFTDSISGQKWYLSNSEIGPTCGTPGAGGTVQWYSTTPGC